MGGNILAEKIHEDLKISMKAREKKKTDALRMLIAALKNAQLDKGEELKEAEEVAIISTYARRCRESLEEFEKAGREDLVSETEEELKLVMTYLPRQLSVEEIEKEVKAAITQTGATSPKDMGKVMGIVMGKFKGKVDGNTVKEKTLELLSS